MKEISVTLEGEEAILFWKDGRVYTEGYDLESEKVALALTRFGSGVGVLLVALNTCCVSEAEFMSEINAFVAEQKKKTAFQYEWPEGQLLFEYYSYSRDPELRWRGMHSARLSEQHYKRMSKDPDINIKIRMARLPELPEKYFLQLLNLSDSWINFELARNKSCPSDVLEILAQDKDVGVRRGVAFHPSCTEGIMEILAQDKDVGVRQCVASNPVCTVRILALLAIGENKIVSKLAQEGLAMRRGLEV